MDDFDQISCEEFFNDDNDHRMVLAGENGQPVGRMLNPLFLNEELWDFFS